MGAVIAALHPLMIAEFVAMFVVLMTAAACADSLVTHNYAGFTIGIAGSTISESATPERGTLESAAGEVYQMVRWDPIGDPSTIDSMAASLTNVDAAGGPVLTPPSELRSVSLPVQGQPARQVAVERSTLSIIVTEVDCVEAGIRVQILTGAGTMERASRSHDATLPALRCASVPVPKSAPLLGQFAPPGDDYVEEVVVGGEHRLWTRSDGLVKVELTAQRGVQVFATALPAQCMQTIANGVVRLAEAMNIVGDAAPTGVPGKPCAAALVGHQGERSARIYTEFVVCPDDVLLVAGSVSFDSTLDPASLSSRWSCPVASHP